MDNSMLINSEYRVESSVCCLKRPPDKCVLYSYYSKPSTTASAHGGGSLSASWGRDVTLYYFLWIIYCHAA